MSERRMFAKTIIDSDMFLEMPSSTQLLYFHLGMRADDEGFVNKPKIIMKICNAGEDDLKVLISKKFIIPFESGVVVIKHWRIHNYIQKDRFKETKYKEELATLSLDENNSYTTCIQNGYAGKVSIGKYSIGKDNIYNIYGRNFETFYQAYPKKVQKALVEKWFIKNKPNEETFNIMITALEKQKQSKQWLKDNGQYIPHPTTWLNQKRWEDEVQENMSALKQMYEEVENE